VQKSKFLLFLSLLQGLMLLEPGLSQTPEIERLLKIAGSSTGKEKIDALSLISKNYYSIDPERGVEYARQALKLADELSIPEAKSLAYNNMGLNYMALSDFDEARSSFSYALNNATKYRDSLEIGNYYSRMGMMYEFLGKLDSALYILNKGLVVFRKIKNDERTGTALENLGTIHLNRGEYKSAIENLIEAVKYYQKAGSKTSLPYVYLKLGGVYSETKDYETSEKWFQKGHDEAMAMGDFQKAALGINGIGINYMNQEKYVEAIEKYNEALIMAEKANNRFLMMAIYGNKGNISRKLKNYPQALSYHLKAFELAKELKQPLKAAIHEFGIGMDYEFLQDYHNARKHYENALSVFKCANAKSNLLTAYESLISVNNQIKDYEKSVQFYIPYIELKDSLNKTELNFALDSLKVKFNTEQTLIENKILMQENELQEKKITFQRIILLLTMVLTGLLISLAVVIFRSRLKIKKSNQILVAKNDEISKHAEELRSVNTKLNELSQFKDSMNSFLAHDLKNPLNTIINYSPEAGTDNDGRKIKQLGLSMLNIVSNMLDISKYENQAMKLYPDNISLTAIINQAFHEIEYFAAQKSIRILLNFTTDYHIDADREIIKRVFINLFTNAIRYSANGTRINVMAEIAEPGSLKISVTDEGEGIDEGSLHYIFEKFNQGDTKKKSHSGSTGIGLTFCKMAIESHKGEIGVVSSPGKGSTFWFTLPLTMPPEDFSGSQALLGEMTFEFGEFQISDVEKQLLQLVCNRLQHFQVSQISDIKEVMSTVNHESPFINKWKTMVLKAVSECNDVKYNDLIKYGSHGEL
jgi:signal transduction histidine kinase/Tfp pilus assembly protein PilF